MKYTYTLTFSFALCVVFSSLSKGKDRFTSPAEINCHVVDENGNPVKEATVEGYFWSPYTHNGVGDTFTHHADELGKCLIRGRGYSSIAGVIEADGYYKTEFDISLGDKIVARETGQWTLKETTITLKRVRNPVPMYAQRVRIEIPEHNKSFGFDMEKGDWVAPYGNGLVVDIYVTYSLEQQDLWTGKEQFEISTVSPQCGLQELNADMFSKFKSVYDAPSTGYNRALKYVLNRTKTKIIEEQKLDNSSYIVFRSRAVVDEEEELLRANYGKIYPPIRHGRVGDKSEMVLIYYLNPTPNDRNLEFDPGRNLFKNLSSMEQVNEP